VPETGLAEFGRYSSIMERPVFFSDRRLPVVELAGQGDPDDLEVEPIGTEEVSDLRAGVAGIVITPEMKLAMVRDDEAGKTFVLREGMSLEGEQAAWMIESIQPREVSFVSVDGRRTGLELQVHTSGLTVQTPRPTSRLAQRETEARPDDPEAAKPAERGSE
jgi:type II secretory pathway component PulC